MGPAAGNGAGEGDGVVVEVVGGDGTLGSEDEGGGFGGGKAFEEVGNSFVVVDFFETAEGGGEVVGFGVLLALLVDGQDEEFEKIYQLNKSILLPISLDEIEISKEQWEESTDRIPDMSDVAHYPYKVTKEMLKNAMARLEEKVRKDNHVR